MGGMNLSAEYLPRCTCGHLLLDHEMHGAGEPDDYDHCGVCHELSDDPTYMGEDCFHEYTEAE